MDKRTVESAVAILCVIATILLIMGSFDGSVSRMEMSGRRGKYHFSTTQTSTSPNATCSGYLELDSKGRPIFLSYAIGVKGKVRSRYGYAIGKACYTEPVTENTVYKDLRPDGKTNASHETELKVSSNRKRFLIRMENPPAPWNLRLHSLSFTIQNAYGQNNWKSLPPIVPCPSRDSYKFKYGDTLSSIDDRYGVPLSKLEKANPGIRDVNAIQPGTTVKIPHARPHPYVVKKGDSLRSIDRRYGARLGRVLRDNPQIRDRHFIYPGEKLKIMGYN